MSHRMRDQGAGIGGRWWVWAACLLISGSAASAQPSGEGRLGGFSPRKAVERMTLPPGFAVDVFASEPDVRQPVAACFDERGRMWVIEYLQYPNPAGLKPVEVDVYLRTRYDRVPEPPPHGPRGADRIKILEDTDGDGRVDRVKTFLEGLNLASAIAVGHGGVFVGQAPYLLFYPDRDRDDVPDGDPEVLVTGFGLEDAHATLNSMTWGPDGWLYGAQGSTVTAQINGIEFQQGIWRYEPISRRFELFAEGGGNTWGLDFDRAGHAFGSSNGGFICFHMVQGAYYWKGFAKHGPLHNPRSYGYFDCIPYEGQKQGGHVTPGGIIYKGGQFPPEFNGVFIGGNLLSNTVYWHELSRKGSTFQGRHAGTLIDSHDAWFRPIDLLTGPDGSVYLVDWYDQRASHLDPRDNWDRSNGRIYRIRYGEPRTVEPFDLASRSSRELVAYRTDRNDWWPDTARRILAERRDATVVPELLTSVRENSTDAAMVMRDLWAMDVSGGLSDEVAQELLSHPIADVRRWVVRRLGDDGRMNDAIRARLVRLASQETDSDVRSQLAASCQRWESGPALAILAAILERSEDASDPHIPLMVWWAIEKHMRTDLAGVEAILTSTPARESDLVRQHLVERAARALAEGGSEAEWRFAANLLAPEDDDWVRRVVNGLEKGLEGRRLEAVPAPLSEVLPRLLEEPTQDVQTVRLAARLGSPEAVDAALRRVKDATVPDSQRASLLELLGAIRSESAMKALRDLLTNQPPAALQMPLLAALGSYADPSLADAMLASLPKLSGTAQSRAIDLMCGRKEWARKLIDSIGLEKAVKPTDLKPSQVLLIAQLGDDSLIEDIEEVWGRVPRPNSEEKAKRIAEVRGTLPEGDKGNATRGVLVFREQCAGCHKLFGDGEAIGPDLTGADRSLDFLLESLVNPSAVIRKEYQPMAVALVDGRVLTGLIVEESEGAITLFDSQKQKTIVPRVDIEEMKASETSVMPDGLLDPLKDEQIRDLFRYLQSSGPPGG